MKNKGGRPKGVKSQITFKTALVDNINNQELLDKINKRLKEKITYAQMNKVIADAGEEIFNWVRDNPEGFKLPNNMGYFAISRFIKVPFRENRWETIERIQGLTEEQVSEAFRAKLLRKYGRKISIAEAKEYLEKGISKIKFMWFNKKNTTSIKSLAWRFFLLDKKKDIMAKFDKSKYYTLNFQDFFDYKIKPDDK